MSFLMLNNNSKGIMKGLRQNETIYTKKITASFTEAEWFKAKEETVTERYRESNKEGTLFPVCTH